MRTTLCPRSGFTLIELLVVVAIMALLMSILMPSLSRAREQARAAACASNMHQIGLSMLAYAGDDHQSQALPLHFMMFRPTGCGMLPGIAHAYVWGGRDARQPLDDPTCGLIWLTGDERGHVPPGLTGPAYGAAGRPLNRYMMPGGVTAQDVADLPVYKCPSDRGFSPGGASDVTAANFNMPCYDLFGNSYRANLYGFKSDEGALSISPWGHGLQMLPQPARLVHFVEPTFLGAEDWHRRRQRANVAFVDGSVRATRGQTNPALDPAAAEAMGLRSASNVANGDLVRQGPEWRMDVWPALAARIWGHQVDWNYPFPVILDPVPKIWDRDAWPFSPYLRNLR